MKKKRNVLLLEPNYKNKYPPIGLMKLATYHRMLGDNVVFFKGELNDFVLKNITSNLVSKLTEIDDTIIWNKYLDRISEYIKTGKKEISEDLIKLSKYELLISGWFIHFRNIFRKKEYLKNPEWDRICITTLFTFHWQITIDTIEFAKNLVKDINELKIGGVLATVLSEEVEKATGIKTHKGLLDKAGILDNNKIIIDDLPLDYSILEEIEYKYPENNAYYGYMTRGCIRKCSFCAVPKLEPKFQNFVPLKEQIISASKKYGEKRNLLLLDNNVLASDCFSDIIEEIKASGFSKTSKYIEPNQLDLAIANLKSGYNDRGFINKSHLLLHDLLKRLKGENQQNLYDLMDSLSLLKLETTTKENILAIYPDIKELYEKFRNKTPKQRYVDFNQGVDARLIVEDETKMKLLSEIPIRPLRIAFDSMKYEKVYVKAVELAAKYGINKLSNYLLYNEKDKPVELYQRLKINVELCDSLGIDIYSFPMKFHPINGEKWFANRHFIGKYWNRKFIRAIQTILNATKGKIGKGKSFFYEAFGKDESEYFKLLYMPETYILFRFFFKNKGYTEKWWNEFNGFSDDDLDTAKSIIENNDFSDIENLVCSNEVKDFLQRHYLISRDDINNPNSKIFKEKEEYDNTKNKQ
ncbi:MAG: hypothetical protein M0Q12_03615 [Synergistaceae bacterium]|jgi:hypothetical protein|nr:hypothetical protein [Synergistaceae bacterium]MDD3860140.1 hypothetical protein [Bacteroidales bacterium]